MMIDGNSAVPLDMNCAHVDDCKHMIMGWHLGTTSFITNETNPYHLPQLVESKMFQILQ